MNERIGELAEQSLPNVKFWNEEITKGNTPPKNRAITLDELENFAELIIRECANLVPTIWSANPLIVSTRIKERFGVEE